MVYNMLMVRDDEAEGFLGVTYIPHGSDHHAQKDATEEDKISEKHKKTAKQIDANDEQLQKMHQELATLEKQLHEYEIETEERLKHLERLAGHPMTPQEKVFRIQEDS